MANFAIMRAKKLKGMGSVASSLGHCFRERETLNADSELTPKNQHLKIGKEELAIDSTDKAMGRLRDRLPEKRRKDAVLAVEYMMTASPEWWETADKKQRQEFFSESLGWLVDKYGAGNIVAFSIHNDEKTPHASAYVVPRTQDGRLSAKEFIGNRTKMSDDQTSYAAKVEHLGLERGIKNSGATHTRIQAHYGAIARTPRSLKAFKPSTVEPKVLEKGFLTSRVETSQDVANRLTKLVHDQYETTVAIASTAREEARKRKEAREAMLRQEKRLEALQEPFKGLSKSQLDKIIRDAAELRKENEQEKIRAKEAKRQMKPRGMSR
jgi:hypothetical protein